MLLGAGAISAASTQANTAPLDAAGPPALVPQRSSADFRGSWIWRDDSGRILLSEERGGDARELRLGDTVQARDLKARLERAGATAAAPHFLPHRIILVGGGGEGTPPDRDSASRPPGSAGDDHQIKPSRETNQQQDANAGVSPRRHGDGKR